MRDYTAGEVMDSAASLLNDTSKSLFTYDVQLPYLKMADDDLSVELLSSNASQLSQICEIDVLAGAIILTLPCDFFIPIKLQERDKTSINDDDFVDMIERGFEPSKTPTTILNYWSFRNNRINFVGATVDKTIRLLYKKALSTSVDFSIVEIVPKAKNFLAFRTAALCVEFIGQNKDRADSLNLQAVVYLDKLTGVLTKNNQGVRVRRKPFRLINSRYYR